MTFMGHSVTPIWTTAVLTEEDQYFSPFNKYYAEISNSGEFAVRSIHSGPAYDASVEPECVWSTTSCNKLAATIISVSSAIRIKLRKFVSFIQRALDTLKSLQNKLFGM